VVTVETFVPARARVGEGPHWDAGTLYWVDILAGEIHTTTADGTTTLRLPWLVGAAVPRVGGGFVAATADGFAEVAVDGTTVTRQHILAPDHRMNDAKCDPRGRLWAGSVQMDFAAGQGALHVLAADWSTRVVLDGLTQPNGMGWSPDGTVYYLIDSVHRHVLAFDVDLDTVTLSGRRVLTTFPADAGLPDGMCVDADGALWVAMWGGRRIVQLSPDGQVLRTVPMPVVQPSSCAFGGSAMDTLFVTSAAEGLADDDPDGPDGSVFRVTGLGALGLPGVAFAG
jgi:sugar lactone lactonase YvrE